MWACSLWWNTMLEKYDVKQKPREQDIDFSDPLITILSFNPDYFSPRSLSWYCPWSHSPFVHFFNIVCEVLAQWTQPSVWVRVMLYGGRNVNFSECIFSLITLLLTVWTEWTIQTALQQYVLSSPWQNKLNVTIPYHTFVECVMCKGLNCWAFFKENLKALWSLE